MGLALSGAAKKTAGFFFGHDVQGMRRLRDAPCRLKYAGCATTENGIKTAAAMVRGR